MHQALCSTAFGVFVYSHLALAQVTTGTISGVVRDSTGAFIPGVTVTMRYQDTGITRTLVTNEQGRYQAPSLGLGNYEVQAQREGFQSEVRRRIVLTVGREAVVNFDLQVGAVTQLHLGVAVGARWKPGSAGRRCGRQAPGRLAAWGSPEVQFQLSAECRN